MLEKTFRFRAKFRDFFPSSVVLCIHLFLMQWMRLILLILENVYTFEKSGFC